MCQNSNFSLAMFLTFIFFFNSLKSNLFHYSESTAKKQQKDTTDKDQLQIFEFPDLLNKNLRFSSDSDQTLEKCIIKDGYYADLRGYEQGGAVFVKNNEISLQILNCLFVGCSAQQNGGAVYASSPRFDLEQSCFLECFVSDAAWSGQSFYTMCNIVNVNSSTVFSCPPSANHRGSEAIILVGGVQNILQLNSSHNVAAQYAGGFATSESISFSFRRCMIYHDVSPNHILAFVHLRPDDDVSYCNIIRNKVYQEGIVYVSGGYAVMRRCVFKRNSGLLAVFNNAYGPGFLTIEECAIDVPERRIMEDQFNLFNLGSTFTQKPTKNNISKNVELNSDNLVKMYRYINLK